jgi:hypothetical protein
VPSSPQLTTTARCLSCDWTAEGPWADVDKLAAAHTEKPPKHPTSCETRAA